MEVLERGDRILADRGYLNKDDFLEKGAELIKPHFKTRKQQLTRQQTEFSRRVAHERIHVERVIGNLKKKFTILRGLVKVKDFACDVNNNAFIGKVFLVCCCLHNAFPSIVPPY